MRKSKQSTAKLKKKAQYNLDKKIAEIFALSSRKFTKYEFLSDKDTIWIFSVRQWVKKQTDIAENNM